MLAAIGNEVDPETLKSYFQIAAERLMSEVFRGNVQAFREFADRVDGRATQSVELTGGLQVQHSASAWEAEYNSASHRRRTEMLREHEDEILARAKEIRAKRADTPENHYRDRMREYDDRIADGESHEAIQADFATRPLVVEPGSVQLAW
jgi:hypothetical protein